MTTDSKQAKAISSPSAKETARIGHASARPKVEIKSPPTKNNSILITDPADLEHDEHWQAALTSWLGKLATYHERFHAPEFVRDLVPLVGLAAEVTNDAAMFITQNLDEADSTDAMAELMEQVGHYLGETMRICEQPVSKGSWWSRVTQRKSTVSPEACCRALKRLPLILERCVALLGSRFRLRESTFAWMDASGSYLLELKQTLAWTDMLVPKESP